MEKLCNHMDWDMVRDSLIIHWKKLMSALFVAISIFIFGIMCVCTTNVKSEPTTSCEPSGSPSYEITDSCPWHLVMSDLTHRLRLLEMAFKEQVIAREVIAAEVTNQSYSNLELEKKLDEFVSGIKQLSNRLDKLKDQMSDLSSRLYSDECLGFLVLIFVIFQIILAVRTKIREKQGYVNKASTHNGSTIILPRSFSNNVRGPKTIACSVRNNNVVYHVKNINPNQITRLFKSDRRLSINGIIQPSKQGVTFKQDACAIFFSKHDKELNASQAEIILKHVTDGIKFPIKQSYLIDSQEALKECPRAKAYVAFVDSRCLTAKTCGEENDGSSLGFQQLLDLHMTSLRLLNLNGGHVIVVLINEQGSQQLPDHALYNTSLPSIQSWDILRELAYNGKLTSIWKEFSPYQLSHVKKIGRSILSIKGK